MTTIILLCIFAAIASFWVGIQVGKRSKNIDGTFFIVDTDPDVQKWILDLNTKDPKTIMNKKNVCFKVSVMDEGDV